MQYNTRSAGTDRTFSDGRNEIQRYPKAFSAVQNRFASKCVVSISGDGKFGFPTVESTESSDRSDAKGCKIVAFR